MTHEGDFNFITELTDIVTANELWPLKNCDTDDVLFICTY